MKLFKNDNFKNILILVIVAMIICLPMLNKKLAVYYDDGIQHISRAYGTFEAIKKGVFLGNVIPSFANSFGYSWNLFYGASTTFGIIIFKLLTGSYIMGYKIFNFVCLLLSGVTMYFFVKKISENSNIALLSGAIYMIAPYHLTDIYVRNATGEFASFIFIPMIFSGLYSVLKNKDGDWILTLGSIGLIFTHNITSFFAAFLAFIYIIINFKELKNKNVLKKLVINIILITAISACYLIPMIEIKLSADYQVFQDGAMSNLDDINEQRLSIRRLFVTRDGEEYVFELGPYMIIMLAFSLMTTRSIKKEYKKDYLFFLLGGILTMIITTKIFPWRIIPKVFRIVQFPWRLLEFTSFFFSIVAAINMGAVIKRFSFKDSIIIIAIAIFYIIALRGFVLVNNVELSKIEEKELGRITGKDNECIAGMGKGEYLPVKVYNNKFYIATREDKIYAIEGKAVIEKEEKDACNLKAKIKTFEEETILELPYIYYPGYEITLDGMHVESFETENGMLGINVNTDEEALLEVKYSGSSIMKQSLIISITGVMGLIIYIIAKPKKDEEVEVKEEKQEQ